MFQRVLRNPSLRRTFTVRNMGGGHHAPPQGGFDGFVRKYLPHDHQVVLGIMGFYASLYLVSKLVFGGKKEVKDNHAVSVAVATTDGEIPNIDSAEFDSWISAPGNVEKLLS